MKSLSVGDSLRASWKLTKKHFKFLFLAILAVLGTGIIHGILNAIFQNPAINFIITLIYLYVDLLIAVGMTNIYLKITGGETPAWSDFIEKKEYVWRYLGMGFLVFLISFGVAMVVGGILAALVTIAVPVGITQIVLFIIIGILALSGMIAIAIRYMMAPYLIIDKKY